MRGDSYAAAGSVVVPSMIGTDEAIVGDASARKFCAAMQAQVLPERKARGVAPQNEILSEEAHAANVAERNLRGTGNDVPIVKQNGVVEHGGRCVGEIQNVWP